MMRLKKIIRNIIALFCLVGWSFNLRAQQFDYGWQLGVGGGFTNYLGDLSPSQNWGSLFRYNKNEVTPYAWRLHLMRRFSGTVAMRFSYSNSTIRGNDRYNSSWQFDPATPNFNRSLNFQTHLHDYSLSLMFFTNNGKFLNKDAIVAPYFFAGIGLLHFSDVYADIKNTNGQFYDYVANPNLRQDGTYETDVTALHTEGVRYPQTVWEYHAGGGVKIRVLRHFSLFAEATYIRPNSDYLDDASGKYPSSLESLQQYFATHPNQTGKGSNPRGGLAGSDQLMRFTFGINYHFGRKKPAPFYAMPLYSSSAPADTSTTALPATQSSTQEEKSTGKSAWTNEDVLEVKSRLRSIDRSLQGKPLTNQLRTKYRQLDSLSQVVKTMNQSDTLRSNPVTLDVDSIHMQFPSELQALHYQIKALRDSIHTEELQQRIDQESGKSSRMGVYLVKFDTTGVRYLIAAPDTNRGRTLNQAVEKAKLDSSQKSSGMDSAKVKHTQIDTVIRTVQDTVVKRETKHDTVLVVKQITATGQAPASAPAPTDTIIKQVTTPAPTKSNEKNEAGKSQTDSGKTSTSSESTPQQTGSSNASSQKTTVLPVIVPMGGKSDSAKEKPADTTKIAVPDTLNIPKNNSTTPLHDTTGAVVHPHDSLAAFPYLWNEAPHSQDEQLLQKVRNSRNP